MFRYALVARGPSDAEDLVAETFQKACFAWRGDGTIENPLAWLLTLYMRYAGGLSADENGEALVMSASGVRSAIGRALAVIRARALEDVG